MRGRPAEGHTDPDTREVAGGGKRKRKQKRPPSDYRRDIRRALEQGNYERARMAAAILRTRTGTEEGEAFARPAGKTESGEIIVARARAREEGERLPVLLEPRDGA